MAGILLLPHHSMVEVLQASLKTEPQSLTILNGAQRIEDDLLQRVELIICDLTWLGVLRAAITGDTFYRSREIPVIVIMSLDSAASQNESRSQLFADEGDISTIMNLVYLLDVPDQMGDGLPNMLQILTMAKQNGPVTWNSFQAAATTHKEAVRFAGVPSRPLRELKC